MINLAPHLSTYLQEHLPLERRASEHTVQSYTDCFRMLVIYASERTAVRPCHLKVEHFTAQIVIDFLHSLEKDRNSSASTCNVRLAAIKSFFRYLEYRVPSCLGQAMQIRAIPQKLTKKPLIDWLEPFETQAILNAPKTNTLYGIRDRAMLHVCYAAGLRASELLALSLDSFSGPEMKTLTILGKGRRLRELPLWRETTEVLNDWIALRPSVGTRLIFFSARGQPLSTDGFACILKKHVATAIETTPSLRGKRITPHVLRHSSAMAVLHATKDIRKVSLWLGHEHLKSTEAYLRASPAEKLMILEANASPTVKPGHFTGIKDDLMKLLNG